MKIILAITIAAALCLPSWTRAAAETNAVTSQLKSLVNKVQTKLKEGQNTEAELAPELKEFDALLAAHKAEKTDEVAQIPMMKAMLYLQVFDNTEKATEIFQIVKRDFPETKAGQNVDKILESVKQQEESKKIQRSLAIGTKFPPFEEKDLNGKPLSLASYKGKVVLVDFWATWCGPCVAELPNVIKAYEKYHAKGFEIIGISLDQDEAKLKNFIKEKNMPWAQYFDGKGWKSKLGTYYGVNSIPATYLLDGQGKIIGRDLRGPALDQALAKALEKK